MSEDITGVGVGQSREGEKLNRTDRPGEKLPQLNALLAHGDFPPHVVETYNVLRHILHKEILRAQGRPTTMRLITSRKTFTDYLSHDPLIAGPWDWVLADAVRFGDVKISINGEHRGSFTVSSIELIS